MSMDTKKNLGAGIMLLALVFASRADAQETEAPAQAVDTAAQSTAAGTDGNTDNGALRESIDPAVPTAVLAQDATRTHTGNRVMDRMELGRTEITGNQELPKVLYIVPWQKANPSDLLGQPVNTLLDEVLAPLDREEFIREVDYYGDLYGDEEE